MKVFHLCVISSFLFLNLSCQAQVNYTPNENWCIQKATDQNNNDVFITANLGYKDYAYKAKFPWWLVINIATVDKYANGHPTTKEATVLNATEDIITTSLSQAGAVQYVGRVTVKDYRELYYFVADPKEADAVLSRLTKKRQLRVWEYQMQQDIRWDRVEPFFSESPTCL
jgi:hypothetical protein